MLIKYKMSSAFKVGQVIYFNLEDYISSNFAELIIELKKYVSSNVVSRVCKVLSLYLNNKYDNSLFDDSKGVYLGYNTQSNLVFLEDKTDSNTLILKDNILIKG